LTEKDRKHEAPTKGMRVADRTEEYGVTTEQFSEPTHALPNMNSLL